MFPRLSARRCFIIVSITFLVIFYTTKRDERSEHRKVDSKQAEGALFDRNLLERIEALNNKSVLLNEDKYSSLTDDDLVIVVQVHDRLSYLQLLIDSLSKVKGIERVLVVFSHDLFHSDMNSLVRQVTFCKIVQIFYPFSQQIWTHTFPGTSLHDCPKRASKWQARMMDCSNAEYPDSYGNYRESQVTQIKHHWFWKLNHVFKHLDHTKHHQGDFVFVEEDHYFSPDFLHVWRLMKQIKQNNPSIDMCTLGHYDKIRDFRFAANRAQLVQWFSGKHNMGFTIDRVLWNQIESCSHQFCTFDDYNWDWSLMHTFQSCLARKINTLLVRLPRLYHIGTCGIHHHGRKCDVMQLVNSIQSQLEHNIDSLFPSELLLDFDKSLRKIRIKNNGGWSDPRDHQLCKQFNISFEKIMKTNSNFAQFR